MSSYYKTAKGEILLFCLEKFQSNQEKINKFTAPYELYILIICWHAILEFFLINLVEKRDVIFLR